MRNLERLRSRSHIPVPVQLVVPDVQVTGVMLQRVEFRTGLARHHVPMHVQLLVPSVKTIGKCCTMWVSEWPSKGSCTRACAIGGAKREGNLGIL